MTIPAAGGPATFAITRENYAGSAPLRITPSTANWADITILAEPRKPEDGESMGFTGMSSSGKPGAFVVTFAFPQCGKRDVTVNVK